MYCGDGMVILRRMRVRVYTLIKIRRYNVTEGRVKLLLVWALGFCVEMIKFIIIFILPILLIVFTKLGGKTLVKEAGTSRKRPCTHIHNITFLKLGIIDDFWAWFNVYLLGRQNGRKGLGNKMVLYKSRNRHD